MSRTSDVSRKTKETDIQLQIDLDGKGNYSIDTGIAFFDHMLELFSRHSMIDIEIKAKGDLEVDSHHTIEDVGIVLGQALKEALGNKAGIIRYGACLMPMDETLSEIVIDISGRSFLHYNVKLPYEQVGNFETPLVEEFFAAFVREAGITLHINNRYGDNVHHIIESIFKGLAVALRSAILQNPNSTAIPSTKETL